MLSYQIAGNKVPFVLVHAWPLSSDMWARQLTTLQEKAMLITPDIPGLGRSPRQETPSIPQMARDVADLLDRLKIQEPVVIGGMSMGGYVTFEFLRQFPERVRGVCLLATRANADTPAIRERRFKTIEFLEKNAIDDFFPKVIPNLLGETTRSSNPAVEVEVKGLIRANAIQGICETLRAMAARQDSTELLGQIKCPSIVVCGEEDGFVTPDENKIMQAQIPGSELRIMEKTGHLLNLEQPELFDSILSDFLTKHFH